MWVILIFYCLIFGIKSDDDLSEKISNTLLYSDRTNSVLFIFNETSFITLEKFGILLEAFIELEEGHCNDTIKCPSSWITNVHFGEDKTNYIFENGNGLRALLNKSDVCIFFNLKTIFEPSLKSKSPKLLLHMYISYVRPLVEFSTPVFNPTEVYLIGKLEKVQKVDVKNIFLRSSELRPHFNAPYEQKLEMLGIESLETRRNKFDLIFMNDYLSGKVKCKLDLSVRNSITRGSNKKIEHPNSKKSITRNFFTFRAASKYIKLPRNLQYSHPTLFKKGIKALKV